MRITRLDGTLLYIPSHKVNHITVGSEYQGLVLVSISLDGLHGTSTGWEIRVKSETAARIVDELADYMDPDFVEGE